MIPRYDTTPSPELEAWMDSHRKRTIIAQIQKQLHTARRRGFKRTMVPLADLERLISE